jgi:hypothetical protein
LHYLPLLFERPGAFDYAKPLKQWRKGWPASYHQMLAHLRQKWPEGQGVQEFVRILQLHQTYAPEHMERAIKQALTDAAVSISMVSATACVKLPEMLLPFRLHRPQIWIFLTDRTWMPLGISP